MNKETKRKIKIYSLGIAVPLIVGALSAFITSGKMGLYGEVKTPPLSPPAILFPIVWTLLYILMGVSSAMVFLHRKKDLEASRVGIRYYALSLIFNFAWSIIFFNFRAFLFAFLWLLVLLYFIIQTVICYRKISPLAAYLQIPYVLWTSFAGYLTLGVYFLNR